MNCSILLPDSTESHSNSMYVCQYECSVKATCEVNGLRFLPLELFFSYHHPYRPLNLKIYSSVNLICQVLLARELERLRVDRTAHIGLLIVHATERFSVSWVQRNLALNKGHIHFVHSIATA